MDKAEGCAAQHTPQYLVAEPEVLRCTSCERATLRREPATYANETATQLLQGVPESAENQNLWLSEGASVYEAIVVAIPSDNDWRMTVSKAAMSINQRVRRAFPTNEEKQGAFAAYLALRGAEALVFMLPQSGRDAAGQLIAMVGS